MATYSHTEKTYGVFRFAEVLTYRWPVTPAKSKTLLRHIEKQWHEKRRCSPNVNTIPLTYTMIRKRIVSYSIWIVLGSNNQFELAYFEEKSGNRSNKFINLYFGHDSSKKNENGLTNSALQNLQTHDFLRLHMIEILQQLQQTWNYVSVISFVRIENINSSILAQFFVWVMIDLIIIWRCQMGCVVNFILTKSIPSICWMWFVLKTFYKRNEQHTDHYLEN